MPNPFGCKYLILRFVKPPLAALCRLRDITLTLPDFSELEYFCCAQIMFCDRCWCRVFLLENGGVLATEISRNNSWVLEVVDVLLLAMDDLAYFVLLYPLKYEV